LLEIHWHLGVQRLVRDLNRLYRSLPALHEKDCEPDGFEWIEASDAEQSVIAFARKGNSDRPPIVVLCNFTPVPRPDYRIGVPVAGLYVERLNTDATEYAGRARCKPQSRTLDSADPSAARRTGPRTRSRRDERRGFFSPTGWVISVTKQGFRRQYGNR
jgi:1,4-alpha-glucan branching enzyme